MVGGVQDPLLPHSEAPAHAYLARRTLLTRKLQDEDDSIDSHRSLRTLAGKEPPLVHGVRFNYHNRSLPGPRRWQGLGDMRDDRDDGGIAEEADGGG
jgi:hypothetical protein